MLNVVRVWGLRLVVAGVWIVAISGVATAAPQVVDTDGAIRIRLTAPSVVTVRLDRDGAPVRVSSTGDAGAASVVSFAGLAPGAYRVVLEAGGHASGTLEVTVGAREFITLRATIGAAATETRIEVTDRARSGEGVDFDERWLQDLPEGGHTWALVETAAPFVIVDRMDNGGTATGRSPVMGTRGASWATSSVTFGGMRAPEPNRVGLIAFGPDATVASAISITSGLAPVEVDTPGVVVALTPRVPGPQRRGSLQASFTDPRMVAVNPYQDAPAITRLSSWREFGLQVSGPVGGRTGLLLSAVSTRAEFSERALPQLWNAESDSLFAHLVANPADGQQVRVMASGQRVLAPFEERRQFRDRHVTEAGRFLQTHVTWDRVTTGGARMSVAAGAQHGTFTPTIPSIEGGTVDRVTDGVVPRPAASSAISQLEARATFAPRMFTAGNSTHEWRAGVDLRWASSLSEVLAAPVVGEQVGGLAARVWRPGVPTVASQRSVTHGSAYVADRMALGAALTADVGVRIDVADGAADGAATGITWRTVSPRLSLRWTHGPVSIYGGLGWYTDPLALSLLSHGDPGEATTDVFRWNDLDGDRRVDGGEQGVLLSRVGRGPTVASIDPSLRGPRTFERTIGLELRPVRMLTMRTSFIWRNQTSLIGSVNTGVPRSSYREVLIPDAGGDWDGPADDSLLSVFDRLPESFGKDAYLLTNPERNGAHFEGIEQTWEFTTRRLVMMFGATAHRSRSWAGDLGFGPLENDQNVIGERYERPNATPVLQGAGFFDRSYVGKWSGTYRAPGDITFGFTARYQDGQPFSRVVVATNLSTGPEMIHAYHVSRTRFTYTLTLNTRIEKGFNIAGRRAAVRVDIFNATQHRNEVEEDVLTTPQFRRSSAVQPPLTVRVGFRVAF
jgi:hypothetical protein